MRIIRLLKSRKLSKTRLQFKTISCNSKKGRRERKRRSLYKKLSQRINLIHSCLKVKIKNCWISNIRGANKLWPKENQTMRLFLMNLDRSLSFRPTSQKKNIKLRQFLERFLKSVTTSAWVILLGY